MAQTLRYASQVLLLLAFALPAAVPQCLAQTTLAPPKYSATVQLLISSEDDSLRNQFNSFLNRELRSLGDITIVDGKSTFVVSVIVLKLRAAQGQIDGFSVATLITSPQRTFFLDPLKDKIEDWRLKLLHQEIEGTSYVLHFKLRAGGLDDVRSICQQIIADFDTTTLDEQRKVWRRAQPLETPK